MELRRFGLSPVAGFCCNGDLRQGSEGRNMTPACCALQETDSIVLLRSYLASGFFTEVL
jgi:hypothetical protein